MCSITDYLIRNPIKLVDLINKIIINSIIIIIRIFRTLIMSNSLQVDVDKRQFYKKTDKLE